MESNPPITSSFFKIYFHADPLHSEDRWEKLVSHGSEVSLESDVGTRGQSQQLAVQFMVSHEKSLLLEAPSSEDITGYA